MFVVTLPKTAHDPLAFAKKAASAGADILEIRGDLSPHILPFASPIPLLVTPRGTGGKLVALLQPQYIDLDIHESTGDMHAPKGVKIIRSFHDHRGTPPLPALETTLRELLAEKPDFLKIATLINAYGDIETLDALRKKVPKNRHCTIIGMGLKAHITRMLSPSRDALTYTFIDDGEQAATGQVPLHILRSTSHTRSPRIFGILGGLEVRSSSPLIHNALAHAHNLDTLYTAFLTHDLTDAWYFITKQDTQGLSVTSPWKKKIIPLLQSLDPIAEHIGSVNTVVKRDGGYIGFNTDHIGIRAGYDFWGSVKSVAILGSGGVVPSIIHTCTEAGIHDIRLFAANAEARKAIAHRWNIPEAPLTDIAQWKGDLLVCAISADIEPPLPDAIPGAHALDLRYGKPTRFLQKAREKGYAVHDGLPMFIRQALEQFRLFTGQEPTEADLLLLQNLLKPQA